MWKRITAVILSIALLFGTSTLSVNSAMLSGVRWDGKTIYYTFATSDSSIQASVNSCASVWSSRTNITYVKGSSGVYIDSTYNSGIAWEGLTNIYKNTGYITSVWVTFNTYRMYLNYTSERTKSIVYHELGHALGLDEDDGSTNAVMYRYTTSRALTPTSRDIGYINGTYY